MQSQQITPGMNFRYLLNNQTPQAAAWVRGGRLYPNLSGMVNFYTTPYGGILVAAEFFNLPGVGIPGSSGFFGFHIHETGDCSNNFQNTGNHLNPGNRLHPNHTGDFPPLLSNSGYAYLVFYDKRFSLAEIMGRSVVVHQFPDDFMSQPAGNSGMKIGCGVIMPNR